MTETPTPTAPAADPSGFRASWYLVIGLVGLDYFSTIAYQPSIAFEAAGLLAPLASTAIVVVTFLAALPVYGYLAGRSALGAGSISLMEQLIRGWRGKFLVLVLLGFAATNFIFTRTLSTADAAVHIVKHPSPHWQAKLDVWAEAGQHAAKWIDHPIWRKCCSFWNRQLVITLLLLAVSFLMWPIVHRGFRRRMVYVALGLVGLFLILTGLVIVSGLIDLLRHPQIVRTWWSAVESGNWGIDAPSWANTNWDTIVRLCLWLLPKMALGLSGFEMGLVVAPIIRGRADDDPARPNGQIANTRKLLILSATLMAGLLIGSSLVTTLLIAPNTLAVNGEARERALAYVAHGGALADGRTASDLNPLFGLTFGTLYDVVTVLVLCLAGASVSLGMRTLLPSYLMRFGMELRWAYSVGLIFHLFTILNLVITVVFKASVDAQRATYAVSVVTLLTGASLAVSLDLIKSKSVARTLLAFPTLTITLLFFAILIGIVYHHPSCLLISGLFIVAVIFTSMASRWWRAKEFRFDGFDFATPEEKTLWDYVRPLPLSVLVPHRPGGPTTLEEKEQKIRQRHRIDDSVPIVFLGIDADDPSAFSQRPLLRIREERGQYFINVTRCASVAHVIVAIGLEFSKVGEPPEIHFGWSEEHPLSAVVNFLLFGQGNIPLLVNDLIRRHSPNPDMRPRVIIG